MPKSVLVTGAAKGTGYYIARRFAKEGYDVFLTALENENVQGAAKQISEEYGIKAKGYTLDSSQGENKVIEVFADIKSRGYNLYCLVLCAAHMGINQDALTMDIKDFESVFQTNVIWNFMLCRQAALQMKKNGEGSIVFINSNTAYRAIPDRVAYTSSKGGVLSMMRSLALDWGKYGIRLNSVLPGMIKTDRWENNLNDIKSVPSNFTPLGDIAEFDDVANAVWYFGSDQSRNTTGAELVVDGGNMIQMYPLIPDK